jgi:hypothetical protein
MNRPRQRALQGNASLKEGVPVYLRKSYHAGAEVPAALVDQGRDYLLNRARVDGPNVHALFQLVHRPPRFRF